MDLFEDLKMSPLDFSFVIIYRIPKTLVMLRNHLNYLKDIIFKCFLNFYLFLAFFFFFFSQHIMMENPRPEEENIFKNIRNLFRLKEELNYIAIKDT